MGFRFKKVSFVGGDSNFPIGTSQSDLRAKSESIVKGVVQALIDLNIGWGLDSTRSTSITDFTEVPVVTDTRTYPGLFLVNSVSGNKLFICYIASTNNSYGIYTNATYSQLYGAVSGSYTTPCHSGLIMSMIPGDANESFGSSFGSSFLPSSATRLIGTCAYTTDITGPHNIAYRAVSSDTYMYGIWATEYCIMISVLTNLIDAWRHVIAYAVGRILSTLSHEADNAPTARYGAVQFSFSSRYLLDTEKDTEMRRTIGKQNTQFLATSTTKNKNFPGLTTHIELTHNTFLDPTLNVSDNTASGATAQIFNSSGGIINNTATTTVTFMPLNYCTLADTVAPASDKCRWTPFLVYVYADDLSTNGVVPGDGVKGLLDTDLFRCSSTNGYTSQTDIKTYGNGKFFQYLYNILLGWDPNNESLT